MERWRRLLLSTAALMPLGIAPASAGPNGAAVVAGSATVQGQGSASVVVNQTSQSAIINWNTFNIGAGESTRISMPSSSSVELDRVTGGLGPSQILGSLSSNGKVFLVNPDGILFGQGAKVNVGSFLATTHDISNSDFMAGRYIFSIPGNPSASVVNAGSITAQTDGFAALVAPGVRNTGTITARLGTISLASGNAFTLDMYGDNLITLGLNDSIAATVTDVSTGKPLSSLVSNSGRLKANGGTVRLTAVAARRIVNSVINNTGVIEANTIGRHRGMIVLGAATSSSKPIGAPAQTVKVSGTLSTAGRHRETKGGTIEITGENIQLTGATLNASGRRGGGTVLVGGDWGGGHPDTSLVSNASAYSEPFVVPTAATTTVDATTIINASAIGAGNGGKVVVWSDAATAFDGSILAKGGARTGDGGFVETSGHELSFNGSVNTSAPNGPSGTLLLDPLNATIAATSGSEVITTSSIETALSSGNVIVTTVGTTGAEAGDISVASSLSWANANTLTLNAYRDIDVNTGVTIANTGAGNLVLRADATGNGVGTVSFNGTGHVDFSGSTGTVSIFYDPQFGYVFPLNYGTSVQANGAVPNQLTAYMLVNNESDLQNVSQNLTGAYALGNNIDAAGANFIPIGNATTPFQGKLNGLGFAVNNLTITSSLPDVGLFGAIGSSGNVQNLTLNNVSLTATGFDIGAGALASVNSGLIGNVIANGSVRVATGSNVGGLAGSNSGDIYQSGASVNVSSSGGIYSFGGLVGANESTIRQSYASGSVSGGNSNGGLVGYSAPGSQIIQSYATGEPSGLGNVGGLVGWAWSAAVDQSYATGGNLIGATFALSGPNTSTFTSSYWDLTNAAGQTSSAGGTAITDLALKSGLPAGFDSAVWGSNPSINNGYPYLLWTQASPSSSSPTTFGPTTTSTPPPNPPSQTTAPPSDPVLLPNHQVANLAQPINTTVAESTPPVINNLQSFQNSIILAHISTPASTTSSTQQIALALQGTPNQNGGSPNQEVTHGPSGNAITTWGYDSSCNCLTPTAGQTNFAPIDTMKLLVGGQQMTLSAYANVEPDGQKDAGNGPFQCTALVSQYLSILGFKNAPSGLPNGKDVTTFLAHVDGQYFNSSQSVPPQVGSIVSMLAPGDPAGHVAIVKGITQQDSNTIVVTLIEDNFTFKGQNTFAINRQMTFVKGSNGAWSSSYQYGDKSYSVRGWVTPTSVP